MRRPTVLARLDSVPGRFDGTGRGLHPDRRLAALAGCAVIVACTAGSPGTHEPPRAVSLSTAPAVLEPASPSHSWTLVKPAEDLRGGRLVEVEIAEVVNPAEVRLSFEVSYRPPGGEERRLGSFALFPPHNPGTFLVPTRGELAPGGTIELRMTLLDEPGPADEIRVVVARIALRRD